ncbi:MAG: hypothetical protein WCN98_13825, partial [Verrucomicrobiaceae bacterium]
DAMLALGLPAIPHARVEDGFEPVTRFPIPENNAAEGWATNGSVRPDHILAEAICNLFHYCRIRGKQLMDVLIR